MSVVAPDFTCFNKINWMYVLNVVIGVVLSLCLSPVYINRDLKNIFIAEPLVKIIIFLVVAGGFVAFLSAVVPDLAPYEDTTQQVNKFLKSKGIVAPPSFRS